MARCAEWDKCLRCRGNQHLIDNIEFHNDDIKHAGTIINKEAVDAVRLLLELLLLILLIMCYVCYNDLTIIIKADFLK